MSCKLKGMQGFQNVLKYIAANSGKVGACGNQDCLSQADCYDQSSRQHIAKQPAELWRSPACFETPGNGMFSSLRRFFSFQIILSSSVP